MEIKVTHSVPYDKGYETRCMYNDGDFWGHSVCAHHVYRDRTHGRQAPVERRLPKCALFGVWLDGEYKKCDACLEACKDALDKPMKKPLTLEDLAITRTGDEVWEEQKIGNSIHLFRTPALVLAYMCYQCDDDFNKYGRQVRAWKKLPTQEEMEAATWEI